MSGLKYWLWLTSRKGMDPVSALSVLDHFITPERAYYADGEDYDADMAKMELCPHTQAWWTHTKPCFVKFSIRPDSEFYADLKQIFHFD